MHLLCCSTAIVHMVVKEPKVQMKQNHSCSSAKIRMVVKVLDANLLTDCSCSTTQIRKKGGHCMTWLSRVHVSPVFISCEVVDRLQCTTQTIRHEVVYCSHQLLTGTFEKTLNIKATQISVFRTCSMNLPLVKRFKQKVKLFRRQF